MRKKKIYRSIVQYILLCLVLGSLFGGIIGMVIAGESSVFQQDVVLAGK